MGVHAQNVLYCTVRLNRLDTLSFPEALADRPITGMEFILHLIYSLEHLTVSASVGNPLNYMLARGG